MLNEQSLNKVVNKIVLIQCVDECPHLDFEILKDIKDTAAVATASCKHMLGPGMD